VGEEVMGFLSFLGFNKMVEDGAKVLEFPKPKAVPYVEPPKPEPKEEPAKVYYWLGLTDNNRVSFHMPYREITMNKEGCQQMIDQLKFFQGQLREEDGSPDNDPDGGLPLPEADVETKSKKAA
jgi:hypothetical protein